MARTFFPPHEPRDYLLLAKMFLALDRGEELPPIVVVGEQALTGSHRLAAWLRSGVDAKYVELPEDIYCQAMEMIGLDPAFDEPQDFNELLEAIWSITEDEGIREALKDQFWPLKQSTEPLRGRGEDMRESMIGEIIVISPQLVDLYPRQHPGEDIRSYSEDEDGDPIVCRICGQRWDDEDGDGCFGDCLEGTGTDAYVVIPAERNDR